MDTLLAIFYFTIFILALILLFGLPISPLGNKNGVPRNWPVLGVLPALAANFDNVFDWLTVIANETGQSTFMAKGPWFTSLNFLITVDPANVQYTSSTRFANFPRGPKSREIFDVFGDGFFNFDGKEWLDHRNVHRSFLGHKQFNECFTGLVFEKAEKGIAVVLDHVSDGGNVGAGGVGGVLDLQDLFSRYTYDLTYRLMVGYDLKSLSLEWPQLPLAKNLNKAMEAVWLRHFLPKSFWKLQRRLGIGHERALEEAKDFLNKFSTEIVSTKHDEFDSRVSKNEGNEMFGDMLTTYLMEDELYRSGEGDEVLKGSLLSLMLAGSDTTSTALTWFFWVLSRHPSIVAKIRAEVVKVIPKDEREKHHVFTPEEISKLVYLHAGVCETLRLYPPVAFQTRTPGEPDVLPSGHQVNPNSTMVIIPLYTMARMKTLWGEDCSEFKPERWITEDGGIRHEPSHKFFTFNAGPRICLGRDLAFTQMKAVTATILHNYDVHVLKEQVVVPIYSVIVQTKYGLHARVRKRWA